MHSKKTINTEIANLFNIKDKTQYTRAFLSLRNKYTDEDMVNHIQDIFIKKHSIVVKSAKKFAEAFRKRYSSNDMPFHLILSKARTHAKKHNITEAMFAEFQRMYERELAGTDKGNEVIVPVTNFMKILGNVSSQIEGEFTIGDGDYENLQNIITEYSKSKQLHARTLLQGLLYNDLDRTTALSGIIDRSIHNPIKHVHPVIAAMFLPKIDLFESHFLQSNIGNIVCSRYNQEPLKTSQDYELFYSMITDPNDVVCNNNTPIGDLLNRFRMQQSLWNSVLHLRNGQYYNTFNEFISSIDKCKLNKYDTPDFIYSRHDGTILKRLLSAFSFRPTVVATLPYSQVFSMNPYAQNIRPCITSIPMINIRLNGYQINKNVNQPIKLSSCLSQRQTFIEDNKLVNRILDVIYSREVLIFYIDRRAHILEFDSPFNIGRLPSAIGGFERINKNSIDIECSITIKPNTTRSDTFCLRSVVIAEMQAVPGDNNKPDSIVVGSSTFLYDYPEVNNKKTCRNIIPFNLADNANWNIKWDPGLITLENIEKEIKNSTEYKTATAARQAIFTTANLKLAINALHIIKPTTKEDIKKAIQVAGYVPPDPAGVEIHPDLLDFARRVRNNALPNLVGGATENELKKRKEKAIVQGIKELRDSIQLQERGELVLIINMALGKLRGLIPDPKVKPHLEESLLKLANKIVAVDLAKPIQPTEYLAYVVVNDSKRMVYNKFMAANRDLLTAANKYIEQTLKIVPLPEPEEAQVVPEAERVDAARLARLTKPGAAEANVASAQVEAIAATRRQAEKAAKAEQVAAEKAAKAEQVAAAKAARAVAARAARALGMIPPPPPPPPPRPPLPPVVIPVLALPYTPGPWEAANEATTILVNYIWLLMSSNCGAANHIYHYDPAKSSFKHSPYAVYDILDPPRMVGPQGRSIIDASRLPEVLPGVPVDGLTKDEYEEKIKTQGIIFIYQNFNHDINVSSILI